MLMDPNAIMRAFGEEFPCHSKGCDGSYTAYQKGYAPPNHVHTGYCDKHNGTTRRSQPKEAEKGK